MAINSAGITWERRVTYVTRQGSLGGRAKKVVGDMDQNLSIEVAASAADQLVDIDWQHARLLGIAIDFDKKDTSDDTAPNTVTIDSNSTSTPGDTVTVPYGEAWGWLTGDVESKPFASADVTKLYLTNDRAVALIFKLSLLWTDGS